MTLIIGIKCSDGVVLGADGAATLAVMGQPTIRQQVRNKLQLLDSQTVLGVSGPVGIGQRFAGFLQQVLQQGIQLNGQHQPLSKVPAFVVMQVIRDNFWNIIRPEVEISQKMAQSLGNSAMFQTAISTSLVCLLLCDEPALFSFDEKGAPEQATSDLPFVAIGGGQQIADPFLAFIRRIYWPRDLPNVDQGIFATVWALHQAIKTNAGGVGEPIQIVIVRKADGHSWRAEEMPEATWQEHLQFIESIEKEMRSLPARQQGAGSQIPPAPPVPLAT
jgi:20S proteasome alpha/beta subunit